jgi:hypothetical protein
MQTTRRAFLGVGIVLALSGCNAEAGKTRDRFMEAQKRDDFAAAFAELHSEARATIPDEAALRAKFEAANIRITDWSSTCSSGGSTNHRIGMSFTRTRRSTGAGTGTRSFVIGVPIERKGKCNGPLVIDLKRDGTTWKVVSFGFE